jgi:carbon starvation protein
MQAIVTNSTVDGFLAAFFAILIIIVIADAIRVWYRVLSARRPVELHEAPYEESRIVAGSGLLPTAEERARGQLVGAGAGRPGTSGDRMPPDDRPGEEPAGRP